MAADPKFKQIAVNQFASDTSDFNGSLAISDGQVFLRSNKFLYCVQDKKVSASTTTEPKTQAIALRRSSPQSGQE